MAKKTKFSPLVLFADDDFPRHAADSSHGKLQSSMDVDWDSQGPDLNHNRSASPDVAMKRSSAVVSPPSSYSSSSSMENLAKTLSPARAEMHRKRIQRMLQQNALLWWELVRYTRNLERKERQVELDKEFGSSSMSPTTASASSSAPAKALTLHHYHHHHHLHHPMLPPLHHQQHTLAASKSLPSLKSSAQSRPHPYEYSPKDSTEDRHSSVGQHQVQEDYGVSSSSYQPSHAYSSYPTRPQEQQEHQHQLQQLSSRSHSSSPLGQPSFGRSKYSPPRHYSKYLSTRTPLAPPSDQRHGRGHASGSPPSAHSSPQTPLASTPVLSTEATLSAAAESATLGESPLTESTGQVMDPSRKRRGNLPKSVTSVLKSWLVQNAIHPYPTEEEKMRLSEATQLSMNQISNWFINARRRILQPILVEAAAAAVAGTDAPMENVHIVRKGKGSRMQVEMEGGGSVPTLAYPSQSSPSSSSTLPPSSHPPQAHLHSHSHSHPHSSPSLPRTHQQSLHPPPPPPPLPTYGPPLPVASKGERAH